MTPDNFRFTVKVPKSVTHDKRLGARSDDDLYYFHNAMTQFGPKLGCILFQLPPSLTMKEGLKKLQSLPFDKRFRYAVEARHKSWFDDEVYSFLKKNDICLAWSQLAEIQTPPVVKPISFTFDSLGIGVSLKKSSEGSRRTGMKR
jgi:uncharacterized protein YecE (DUF72 family)